MNPVAWGERASIWRLDVIDWPGETVKDELDPNSCPDVPAADCVTLPKRPPAAVFDGLEVGELAPNKPEDLFCVDVKPPNRPPLVEAGAFGTVLAGPNRPIDVLWAAIRVAPPNRPPTTGAGLSEGGLLARNALAEAL